eukprot:scaffold30376_cov109-Isochrysis_galbana.AAC.4
MCFALRSAEAFRCLPMCFAGGGAAAESLRWEEGCGSGGQATKGGAATRAPGAGTGRPRSQFLLYFPFLFYSPFDLSCQLCSPNRPPQPCPAQTHRRGRPGTPGQSIRAPAEPAGASAP